MPTISTLVGPTALSLRLFLGWAETGNRGVVSTSLENADPEMVVLHWIDELAKRLDLGVAAVHWLAHRLHRDDKALEHALRLMTPHELDIFLESNLPLGSETSTERMGRHLIERVARGIPLIRPGLAADLNLLLDGYDIPWVRVFTAIGGLIDQNCLPALAVCVSTSSVTRLERIARLLTEFVVAQPRVGLALLAGQDLFDRFIALAPASALKALLLEAIVNLTLRERIHDRQFCVDTGHSGGDRLRKSHTRRSGIRNWGSEIRTAKFRR